MASTLKKRRVLIAATMFGIVPCLLGVGVGLYLRQSDIVWLTNFGVFWPLFCLVISLAMLARRAIGPFEEQTAQMFAWLMIAWTWLFFPLWLMASEIPTSSAIVNRHGQVYVAMDWTNHPKDKVWLLTSLKHGKIVHHVTGTVNVSGIDIDYRYHDQYIATRRDGTSLLNPIVNQAKRIIAAKSRQPRSSRVAWLETSAARERLANRICNTVVSDKAPCSMRLSFSPKGPQWSKLYTEEEAIAERDLPALVQLLVRDDVQQIDRIRTFKFLMEHAKDVRHLSELALKHRKLNDQQFDELVGRILVEAGSGEGIVKILAGVNRLKMDQRIALRSKVLREGGVRHIIKYATAMHVSDFELSQLSMRMTDAFATDVDAAVLALSTFGQRLSAKVQRAAVEAVVKAQGSYALAVLPHMNFSSELREEIMAKIVSDASYEDFETARLSREKLANMLLNSDMRALIASVVKKSETSEKWLEFAIRMLPVDEMSTTQRKSLLEGSLFRSAKSSLEFVSENRRYFDARDVNDVTRQYTRTVTPAFCLHLSHRNKNRGIEYFSEAQLDIFNECAKLR